MINNNPENFPSARDHLANERTFLAWIRTSIGIMAFGFVVEKFSLFIKQITAIVGPTAMTAPKLQGYSSIFGIGVVGLGVLISLFAFIKYNRIEKQLNEGTYRSSRLLNIILVVSISLIGIFLIVYLGF